MSGTCQKHMTYKTAQVLGLYGQTIPEKLLLLIHCIICNKLRSVVHSRRKLRITLMQAFDNVLDIADRHGMKVLIDMNDENNSRCLMYETEERRLKAVIMTY